MIRLQADNEGIGRAAALLDAGKVILWPSGGVYGLATSALSVEGIARIRRAKGRAEDKPFQVLASPSTSENLGILGPEAHAIIRTLWPGFVGVVVPRRSPELKSVAGPGDTVLLVCSGPVGCALASVAGSPAVATSANLSGRKEILTPDEAEEQFVESVDAMIDGGIQTGELNTILDLSLPPYRILREGAVNAKAIMAVLAEAEQK